MKWMPMTIKESSSKKHPGITLLVLMALLCTACGSKLVRGEPPMVRMSELSHQDNNINLQLNIRNINGVDLNIQAIDLNLTVNKDDDQAEHELFVYNGPAVINIVANGTETWSVEVKESEASRDLLDSLENGDVISLPYTLKGSIRSEADGTLRFEREGHIYPLPGKPGYFR
jgi:hypothetical protein